MNPAENYIFNQPQPYSTMLMHIQSVIEHSVPEVSLKYKHRIPFYYFKGKPFCYLNVNLKKGFIDIGFWKATQLSLHTTHLVTENRKMIKSLRYRQLQDIDDHILIDILHEASLLYDD